MEGKGWCPLGGVGVLGCVPGAGVGVTCGIRREGKGEEARKEGEGEEGERRLLWGVGEEGAGTRLLWRLGEEGEMRNPVLLACDLKLKCLRGVVSLPTLGLGERAAGGGTVDRRDSIPVPLAVPYLGTSGPQRGVAEGDAWPSPCAALPSWSCGEAADVLMRRPSLEQKSDG